MEFQKPILKWCGSKSQIINNVMDRFPSEMNNYYEPFLGGASILLALLVYKNTGKIKINGTIYANDLNANLINMYKNIQSDPDGIINHLHQLIREFQQCRDETPPNRHPINLNEALSSKESYYYWTRSVFNKMSENEKKTVDGSAFLIFLNKTCFRGVYREGPNGFNVPYGNNKNPSILNEKNIRNVSLLIQPVIFSNQSFEHVLANVQKNDFCYIDPPYAPENDTSFVSYTSSGFHLNDHRTLFGLCDKLTEKGIKFLLSNSDVALVRNAFPATQYETTIISCRRAIHSKKPESRTNEVLIMPR